MTSPSLFSTYRSLLCFLLFSTLHVQVARSATADQWRSRSIYQVVTDRFARTDGSTTSPCVITDMKYCGGTFDGIISKLDYIQGMGFTAIWISPVVKGIENSAVGAGYHGFWQQDLNTINPHFGTREDLAKLSAAVHARGMYLMVDILANNFAYEGAGNTVDYSKFSAPFNQASAFHKFCLIKNYTDPTDAQQCWLGNDQVSLPDVNTELPEVQSYFNKYGVDLAKEFSIDGYRVDAAKHVPKPFWNQMQSNIGIYMMGENFDGSPSVVCNTMIDGMDGVLNYPLFNGITSVFGYPQNKASDIQWHIYNLTNSCRDTTLMGTFTENHDVPRFGSVTNDIAQRASALAFAMTNDGVPVIYYGSEQGLSGNADPANREALWLAGYKTDSPLYKVIRAVNYARNKMVDQSINNTDFTPYWKFKSKLVSFDDNMIAVRKGYTASLVSVVTNKGSNSKNLGPYMIGDTNFAENIEITDVINCQKQKTYDYGSFTTSLKDGMPQVWIPSSFLTSDFKVVCPNVKSVSNPKISSGERRMASGWAAWLSTAFAGLTLAMI